MLAFNDMENALEHRGEVNRTDKLIPSTESNLNILAKDFYLYI